MDLGLADATAVVVGGSSGMGLATARCLAEEGAHVAVIGRSATGVADAARAGRVTLVRTSSGLGRHLSRGETGDTRRDDRRRTRPENTHGAPHQVVTIVAPAVPGAP